MVLEKENHRYKQLYFTYLTNRKSGILEKSYSLNIDVLILKPHKYILKVNVELLFSEVVLCLLLSFNGDMCDFCCKEGLETLFQQNVLKCK